MSFSKQSKRSGVALLVMLASLPLRAQAPGALLADLIEAGDRKPSSSAFRTART